MRDHDPGSSDGRWTAFEAEAMPHVDRLFRLAMWWERDRREAEDLVQDTLVQALQSFHRFSAGTNCRAWLLTILRHVRSNRRRAKHRRQTVEDPDDRIQETVAFVPPVPQHLTDEHVLSALRGIPGAYQDIILLCDVEELTYKEIAEVLMIPMGTVMSRLHRGRGLLRQQLASARTPDGASRPADVTYVEPPTPALSGNSLQVVERHSCVFEGRRFAHIVLLYKKETVSVLVTDDPRPGSAMWARLPGMGQALSGLSVTDGFHVASFRQARHVVFVVSASSRRDVQDVAQAMAGPLSKALAGA